MLHILKKNVTTKDINENKVKNGFLSRIFGNRAKLASGIYNYKIDVSNSIPTKKQFDLIFSYARSSSEARATLQSAFPRVTVNSLDNYPYSKAFPPDVLQADQTPKSQEYMIKHDFFVPPLAVDWEHQSLASTPETLNHLLEK